MTEERAYPLDIRGELSPDLSRWLWLIKWLLAIPHYIIMAVIRNLGFFLAIFAGVVLLFTGRYRDDMFGVQMGFNRWRQRIGGYVSLFYDDYPPFEFDTRSG